jgi:beta-xylosidase
LSWSGVTNISKVWVADNGDGTYKNPILHADYSDLDVVRVGGDFFSYSTDGTNFTPAGESFTARAGRWIGAKVGLFAVRSGPTSENGYADFDWFRVE